MAAEATEVIRSIDRVMEFIIAEDNKALSLDYSNTIAKDDIIYIDAVLNVFTDNYLKSHANNPYWNADTLWYDINNEEYDLRLSEWRPPIHLYMEPINYIINTSAMELAMIIDNFFRSSAFIVPLELYAIAYEYIFIPPPKPRVVIDYRMLREDTPSSGSDDDSDEDDFFSYQLSSIIQSCLLSRLNDRIIFVLFSFVEWTTY